MATLSQKIGVYTTIDEPVFNEFSRTDAIHVICQYGGYYFESHNNQKVYVSHVNDKLRIAFCDLETGDPEIDLKPKLTGQVTEK